MNPIWWDRQPARRVIGYTPHEREIYMLTEPWGCAWQYGDDTRKMTFQSGYIWDGASIPRVGWTAIGLTPSGIMDAPSLVHDGLYRSAGGKNIAGMNGCMIANPNGNAVFVSRAEADWCIREGMLFAGISKRRAICVYCIVRAFGRTHWGGPMPAMRGY